MIVFEKHQREYSLVSITAVMDAMVSQSLLDSYGATLGQLYSSIEQGAYFHVMPEDSRKNASVALFRRIEEGRFDVKREFALYEQEVRSYRDILNAAPSQYSPDLFVSFCKKYISMFPVFFAGLDPIDFLEDLHSAHQDSFRAFALQVRSIGETTYKDGEQTFVPEFLDWFSRNHTDGYTADQLRYLVYTELIDYIQRDVGLPLPQELDVRRERVLVHQYEFGKMEMWVGDDARAQFATLHIGNALEDSSGMTEVQGNTAQKGKVQGRVCIVKTRADMNKFQDADVIVSEMTDPSFLPIMKRASAFVTDEGGFLCHAAIVARELRIPCIIGTKFATQIFVDGDMVEVDAEKGIVRKV